MSISAENAPFPKYDVLADGGLMLEYNASLYEKSYFTEHPYRPYSDFDRHLQVIEKILSFKPASVLDVGCAYGFIVRRLLGGGIEAFGCDVSEWAGLQSRGIIPGRYIRATAWALPFKDKSFDLLFSEGTLEHIPERHIALMMQEFYRVAHRRLLGVSYTGQEIGHVCLRPLEWWVERLPGNTYLGLSGQSLDRETIWVYKSG